VSLKAFHVLFITASILLAVGLGVWCLPRSTAAAFASFAVGALLIGYETWFLRKSRRTP
jgi:Flp pilus assembly protein TadB